MAWQDDPVKYTPLGGGNILAQWGTGGKFAPGSYIYRQADPADILAGRADPNQMAWYPISAQAPPPAAGAVAASTGVNPTETSYSLYGHIIPLSVFGIGRIGGEIIAGPWVVNGNATFCISFGVPADPYASRSPLEVAFDSEVVWTSTGGFNTEAFTMRWYPGTLTQAADPVEIAHYGSSAVAYRPQMLLWFENLPLSWTKFKKIPYVACLIQDSTGPDVNLGEAFERLARSPWVGYTVPTQFDSVGVTDGLPHGGLIIAQDTEFLGLIQQFQRFYRNWDILQTDALRIVDRGNTVAADINLDRTRLTGAVTLSRASQDSVARTLELSTIDPDADYTIVPSRATRPHEPVNVTTSVRTETVFLPMIMDTHTRQALVTYTLYHEEVARKRVAATAMIYGLEIEPGDLIALRNLGDDFNFEVFKAIETTHGVNYVVEMTLESILRCSIGDPTVDPFWIYTVLLCGFEGVDGAGPAGQDNVFIDDSLKHHPPGDSPNNTQIDTSQVKFGVSSGLVTGFSPSVIWEPSFDWKLSTNLTDEFTVELWARFDFVEGNNSVNVMISASYIDVSWYFGIYHQTTTPDTGTGVSGQNELVFGFKTPTTTSLSSPYQRTGTTGANVLEDIWYHLAVDKDSTGKCRIYVNGVPRGVATFTDWNIYDPGYGVSVPVYELDFGAAGLFGGNRMQGWIDEVRITKGVARYKTDRGFTPPTSPFPRGGPL